MIVKADNSQNGNYTDSYAGTTQMELKNAEVQKAVREGYKYYDANDVLREEKPDEPLSEEELAALLKGSKGYYLFDVVKVEDTYNTTNRFYIWSGLMRTRRHPTGYRSHLTALSFAGINT